MQFSLKNILIDDKRVIVGERVDASNHLVDKDPQSPPINWFSVSLIGENLRSKILRSAAKSESAAISDFSKAEISQFQVSVSSDENVFRFEVAVDDIFTVQVLENQHNVSGIETELKRDYAALWGSNMPSSRKWVKSSPPGTYSRNI